MKPPSSPPPLINSQIRSAGDAEDFLRGWRMWLDGEPRPHDTVLDVHVVRGWCAADALNGRAAKRPDLRDGEVAANRYLNEVEPYARW